MKKYLIIALIHFFINGVFAQVTIVNNNHITISGVTLVQPNDEVTYTADFFYPDETTDIEWLVSGGVILAQNTNTSNGPISVTIKWILPPSISAILYPTVDPNANGIVAIKQGSDPNLLNQAAQLYVYRIGDLSLDHPFIGCKLNPELQYVNYGQYPCVISGVPECVSPFSGNQHTYQWDHLNSLDWAPISGANGTNYQPPLGEYDVLYERVAQNNSGVTYTSPAFPGRVRVKLNDFHAGTLFTGQISVLYGSQPVIYDEMPYGGMCKSQDYSFNWEVSYNYKPWESFGNSLHFPELLKGIVNNSVRIRRTASCGNSNATTNILEFTYYEPPKENQNYVKTNTILVKGIEEPYTASLLPIGDRIQNSVYYDGLARPMQTVVPGVGQSANVDKWYDIVTPIAYDGGGRKIRSYLSYPYFDAARNYYYKPDAFNEQSAFYQSTFSEIVSYSVNEYEQNPLNRVTRIKGAGDVWAASNGNQQYYTVFDQTEEVEIWQMGTKAGAIPETIESYKKFDLYKFQSVDVEGGAIVYDFKDKSGHLLYRKVQAAEGVESGGYGGWLCTYYVYDDLDRLRCTITPKAVDYLRNHQWVLTQSVIDELCYYFDYDKKGRVIYKKTPQAGGVNFVYDERDRLVMTQDEKQKSNNKWSFILYDELDRQRVSGLLTLAKRREDVQKDVETIIQQTTSLVSVSLGNNMSQEEVNVFAGVSVLGTDVQFNTLTYYDDYAYPGSIDFNTNNGLTSTGNPNEEPTVATVRTINSVTGTKLRVLDNSGRVLTSTLYYDEQTRPLQVIKDNIKDGRDIKTSQYDFGGRILNSSSIHTSSGTGYTDFPIYTHNTYDKIGRLTLVSKQFGTSASKDVAAYSYDFFGRLKVKRLGLNPLSGGAEMESLEYTYNLNGQLKGINELYAKKDPATYDKWQHFFGLYLGYDNKDNAFANSRLDGKIGGAMWSTQGDDVQRKYDYSYDKAGRLISANFNQKDNESSSSIWTNAKFDFSVRGNSGNIVYDNNGNIIQMLQMGVIPGHAPLPIDNLTYRYAPFSNKLIAVDETNGLGNLNGVAGDFNQSGGGSLQYAYDLNGNLTRDENKDITDISGTGTAGVEYNYLDKPEKIRIAGKGVSEYVYDAAGNKLQKIFTPDATVTGNPKTTTYIDEYVFEDDKLLFINFEEGRLRMIEKVSTAERSLEGNFDMPGSTGNTQGVFDYFIKDNLGNTRMIITEEQQWEKSNCTADDANSSVEEAQWGQVTSLGTPSGTNELVNTRTPIPPGWTTNTSSNCVKLYNADGKRIGPNRILKVMAGDEIISHANYYYANNTSSGNPATMAGDIINSLIGTLTGGPVSDIVKSGNNNNEVYNLLTASGTIGSYVNNSNNSAPTATTPKAYLNVIFLDENFNFVGNATPQRVSQSGDAMNPLQTPDFTRAPKNGYAYVYLSNESSEFVYFDNLYVEQKRGRIVEENHYYPFGLKIASISSRKAGFAENGNINNLFLYQADYAEHDGETGWDEFDLRNYDPQIGRWMQSDPFNEFPSPYTGMGNDPINNIDATGGSIFDGLGSMIGMGTGLAAGIIWQMNSNDESVGGGFLRVVGSALAGALIGAGVDAGLDFLKAGKKIVSNLPFRSPRNLSPESTLFDNATLTTNQYARNANSSGEFDWPFWETPEAAAYSWGKTYNSLSINEGEEGTEYAGVIFSMDFNGKTYYSYNEPNSGSSTSAIYNTTIPRGATLNAFIHSHGKELKLSDNHFSVRGGLIQQKHYDSDQYNKYEDDFGGGLYDMYLTTPSGDLLMWARGFTVPKEVGLTNRLPRDKSSVQPRGQLYGPIVDPINSPGKTNTERQSLVPQFFQIKQKIL